MAEYVVVLGVITLAIVATFTIAVGIDPEVLERIVGLFSELRAGSGPALGPIPSEQHR